MSLAYIKSKIAQLKRRLVLFLALEGICRIAVLVASIAIASFIFDYFLHLPLYVRMVLLVASALGVLVFAVRYLVQPLTTPISEEEMALAVEKANPMLQDRLISALQFLRLLEDPEYFDSREMTLKVIEETESLSREIRFPSILNFKKAFFNMVGVATVVAVLVAVAGFLPRLSSIWLQRNVFLSEVQWPQRTRLFLIEKEFLVGKEQKIRATVTSEADAVTLWYRREKAPRLTRWKPLPMNKVGNSFTASIPPLKESTYVYLESNTMTSSLYRLRPSRDETRTHTSQLTLELGNFEIVRSRGQMLPVKFAAVGVKPSSGAIYYRIDGGEWDEDPLARQEDGTFKYTFHSLTDPIEFYVEGGDDDDESPIYSVEVLNPPSIDTVAVWYRYPKYAGKLDTPREKPQKHGNITALEGTKVDIEISSNMPLAEATISFPQQHQEILPDRRLKPESKTKWKASFPIKTDTRYSIEVVGENGLKDANSPSYYVRVERDRRPYIKMLTPHSRYVPMLKTGVLPISFEATDDYGIAALTLLHRSDKEEEWEKLSFGDDQLSNAYGSKQIVANYSLEMSSLKAPNLAAEGKPKRPLEKGDTITFKVQARDNNDISGAGIKESEVHTIEIVDKSELLQQLNDKLINIKQQIAKVAEVQMDRRQTLVDFTSVKASIEVGDLARILQLRFSQKGVSRDIYELNEDIARILWHAENNHLWDAYTKSRIEKVRGLMRSIANQVKAGEYTGKSPEVEELLMKAYHIARKDEQQGQSFLKQAIGKQDQILQILEETITLLGEWEDFNEVVRDLERLLEKQKRLEPLLKKVVEGK